VSPTLPCPRIALTGQKGSGKSTAAAFLADALDARQIAIAEPIKKIVDEVIAPAQGIPLSDKEALRKYYQDVGVVGRALNEDIWVGALIRGHGLEELPHVRGYVVEDVRFPNEAVALKLCGFLVVRIAAPQEMIAKRLLERDKKIDPTTANHTSETSIVNVAHDVLIENDGDMDQFLLRLRALADSVMQPNVHATF